MATMACQPLRRGAALVAGACLLVACTSARQAPNRPAAQTQPSPPATPSTAGSASSAPAGLHPFVRPCTSSVSGELGAGWRRDALVAGPLAFVGWGKGAQQAQLQFTMPDGGLVGQKALAVVEPGVTVTVVVAAQAAKHAVLLYDPAAFRDLNSYRLADGERAVTFVACKDQQTQFNGGFVVDGPRCLLLEVWTHPAAKPLQVRIPFGSGACGKR